MSVAIDTPCVGGASFQSTLCGRDILSINLVWAGLPVNQHCVGEASCQSTMCEWGFLSINHV